MLDEYVIKGGHVVDGTGAPARDADVRVVDGVITEIGTGLDGGRVLDAAGSLRLPRLHRSPHALRRADLLGPVAHAVEPPGSDERDRWPLRPVARPVPRGIARLDGAHPALRRGHVARHVVDRRRLVVGGLRVVPPVPRRARGVGINFGTYVGHTAVRLWTMGPDGYEREATADEIEQMQAVVAASIRAGAIGFSTDRSHFHTADGGRPVPSVTASHEETEALIRAAAAAGGVCSAIVDEDCTWIYRLQPSLGAPITWCQIITYPDGSPRQPWPEEQLAIHEAAFRAGARVYPQVTPRPISFQVSLAQPMPFFPVPTFGELATLEVSERASSLPRPRHGGPQPARDLGSKQWVDPNWDKFSVEETTRQPELIGKSVEQIARERGEDPTLVALDIALADDLEHAVPRDLRQ